MPIGEERQFKGVVDLVAMRAYMFANDASGKVTEGDVPAELEAEAKSARDGLIEMVAEADDTLMEKFFEHGTLTQEELSTGLARAVRAGKVFPVFCTSGLQNVGMQPLMDAVVTYVPSPAERAFPGHRISGDAVERPQTTRRRSSSGSGRRLPINSPGASRCFASSRAR
jgi:elongation factor G